MNKNTNVNRLMTKISIILEEFGLIIDEEQYQNIWLLIENISNFKKHEKVLINLLYINTFLKYHISK